MIYIVIHTGAHLVNAVNCSLYYNHRWIEVNIAESPGQDPFQLVFNTRNKYFLPYYMTLNLNVIKDSARFIVPGITGVLMMLILTLILVTSASWFRTRHFNTFYYSHHFLFGPFLVLLIFHPTRWVLIIYYQSLISIDSFVYTYTQWNVEGANELAWSLARKCWQWW